MCKCNPRVRTPYCGKGDCVWPNGNVEHKLAIMRGVHFGMRDCDAPVLWFEVKTDESSGALIVLDINQAQHVIKESEVYKIEDLEGRACWVTVQGNTIHFDKVAKI